jgi:hypothetical protein
VSKWLKCGARLNLEYGAVIEGKIPNSRTLVWPNLGLLTTKSMAFFFLLFFNFSSSVSYPPSPLQPISFSSSFPSPSHPHAPFLLFLLLFKHKNPL